MAILKFIVIMMVLVTGCYSPDIDDCAVTCTTDNECAGDQVCTSQGLCAGAISACETNSAVDAGPTPRMISIRVTVTGDGKVSVGGVGDCDPPGGPMGDTCDMMVPAGPLVIEAVVGPKPFERWTTIVCAGQGPRCEVTLQLNANIGAKFK